MMYIERALISVLESRFDIDTKTVGNYQATMKWDGYSAMIDINYLKDNEITQLCHWDTLDRTIDLAIDLSDKKEKRQVAQIITSILNLKYKIKTINDSDGEDITSSLLKR